MNKIKISFTIPFLITIMLVNICTHTVFAQSIVELSVGNKLPDVEINEIINYKSPKANISDFKGKLLILDFWATYCAPCVSMFPKMDSLQKNFNGKIQFLSVTKEPEKKVTTFLNNMYKVRHIKPISIINDKLFSSYFPYSEIPYYVWIDPNGKVIATTGSNEITKKNIEAILLGKPTTFINRNDIRNWKIDYEKSLFVLSHNFVQNDTLAKREEIPKKNILSYSIASKYVDHAHGRFYFNMDHLTIYNLGLGFLYQLAYDMGYYDAPVRGAFNSKSSYVFEIKDKNLLNKIKIIDTTIKAGTPEMDEWGKNNAVCYEIVYPTGLSWKEKMTLVREDLDRYFAKPMGFKVSVEKRIDSSVTVLRRNKKLPLSTLGKTPEKHYDRYSYSQQNMPLSEFLGVLNSYFFQNKKNTMVNKTDLTGRVDLDLVCDMTKLNSINKALSNYGLVFTVEPTQIDVLVFSDR